MFRFALPLLLAASPLPALAQAASTLTGGAYELGEIQVTARDRTGETIGGATISGEDLKAFQKFSVDQALSLIPGVNASNTGGSRNERLVYVRGFDRFQTTVSIDGVRVFLPADNRIDFARFLTADLAEIQVAKGYVSVLDGPGAIGGAINLVTVKPTAPLEGDLQAATFLNRKGDDEAYQLSGRVGGRLDNGIYWQVSGAYNDRDHYTLPKTFKPTSLEDGGARGNSDTNDWRVNAKLGWQPNETDEYSLNYTRTEGEKNAPYSVTDTANTRFWSWPYWNLESLAFLSRTALTDRLTLKTRLYRNGFDNLLSSYDNAAQTVQSLPRAFNSYYKDHALGGNIELDYALDEASHLKGAFYARQDVHKEWQQGFTRTPATGSPSVNAPYTEPRQKNDEYTYSVAGEYSTPLGEALHLVVGASYDWTNLKEAGDVNVQVNGTTVANSTITFLPVNYPLRNSQALNGQAALTWTLSDAARAHVSVSSRARFPTLFERFSSRFGTAIPNPDVKEERATNYEVGASVKLDPRVELTGAVFYSDVTDALIQIPVFVTGFGSVNQTRNVGKGRYSGFEASVAASPTDTLDLGGNLTYTHRKFTDPTNAAVRPQGVPDWKAFAYANWRPLPKLTLRPSVEYADERWTVTTAAPLTYYRTGSYFLVNLAADYAITDKITVTLAAQNLGDQLYQLTDGFPEAGRSFYASVRARF